MNKTNLSEIMMCACHICAISDERQKDHRSISPPIVIAPVGNTAPVRFITDCSGQFGEIELSCYFPGGSVEAGLGRLLSDDHCDQGAGRHL